MLLIVSPLAYAEDARDNEMATQFIERRIQTLQAEGGNIPRYKSFI